MASWFSKNIGVNEENASLEVYASPSLRKLKQFSNSCFKTKSLNISYKDQAYPPECLPSLQV